MDKAPDWAINRAEKLANEIPLQANNPIWEAFARYIAEHEQPPVDQDVLDVRELLAVWIETPEFSGELVDELWADEFRKGAHDNAPDFQAALAKYREIKARG